MKRLLIFFITSWIGVSTILAQKKSELFKTYIYNKEYNVYMKIDLYEETISIPGQDLYGKLHGYLGKRNNSFSWIITSASIKKNTAHIELINDYGSEDLKATLTAENDSLYVLKQVEGSTLKVPNNGKWQKLPKKLEFIKH